MPKNGLPSCEKGVVNGNQQVVGWDQRSASSEGERMRWLRSARSGGGQERIGCADTDLDVILERVPVSAGLEDVNSCPKRPDAREEEAVSLGDIGGRGDLRVAG